MSLSDFAQIPVVIAAAAAAATTSVIPHCPSCHAYPYAPRISDNNACMSFNMHMCVVCIYLFVRIACQNDAAYLPFALKFISGAGSGTAATAPLTLFADL